MSNYQKRQDLEKRYYKEIKNGNYEKAEKIMKRDDGLNELFHEIYNAGAEYLEWAAECEIL